jgi:sugar phosphate permease
VGLLDGSQKIGSSLTGVVMGIIYERFEARGWLISLMPPALLGALLMIPVLKRKGS